jgi:hypothetical protein
VEGTASSILGIIIGTALLQVLQHQQPERNALNMKA